MGDCQHLSVNACVIEVFPVHRGAKASAARRNPARSAKHIPARKRPPANGGAQAPARPVEQRAGAANERHAQRPPRPTQLHEARALTYSGPCSRFALVSNTEVNSIRFRACRCRVGEGPAVGGGGAGARLRQHETLSLRRVLPLGVWKLSISPRARSGRSRRAAMGRETDIDIPFSDLRAPPSGAHCENVSVRTS